MAVEPRDIQAADAFERFFTVAVVTAVLTAIFAWQTVTDWSYEHRGGVTSCTIAAIDEHVEHHESPGGSRESRYYTHPMECDVKSVTEWRTVAEQAVTPGYHLELEYDVTRRFEPRSVESHRAWQTSAQIMLGLFVASSLIHLAFITYIFRNAST
ncbi:hypothetical protein ACFWY5_56145 [Nonomuraea sp. NPDC059007]|uniref:hypothetical protein n=1 Tax=Nonomuraea sp. NPDC059007 TaxID=3346692 RepID=UPI0036BF98F4